MSTAARHAARGCSGGPKGKRPQGSNLPPRHWFTLSELSFQFLLYMVPPWLLVLHPNPGSVGNTHPSPSTEQGVMTDVELSNL